MENQEKQKNKPSCKYCGSKLGYFKIKTKEFQCRSCGEVTKLKEEKSKENGECE